MTHTFPIPILGVLGASAFVVAYNASAKIKTFAGVLQDAGYPIGLCDGTADDVQIQAAIDALPAGGGKVALSEGTFNIAARIVPVQSLSLWGQGKLATVLKLADTTNVDVISYLSTDGDTTGVRYADFRNFRIDGNKANNSTAGSGMNLYSKQCIFKDIAIDNCREYGIILDGQGGDVGGGDSLSNVRLNDTEKAGLHVTALHPDLYISELEVGRCGTGANYYGGVEVNASSLRFTGGNVFGCYNGLVFGGGAQHSGVVGMLFDTNNRLGIWFRPSNPNADIHIVGNTFRGNSQEGTNVYPAIGIAQGWSGDSGTAALEDIVIVGNTFAAFGAVNHKYCLVMETTGARRVVFVGNAVAGGFTTAAVLESGSGHVIRNNSGYVTENSGTATVLNTTTTIVVAHGLAAAPTRVLVTARLWSNAAKAWVTAIDATNFTINVDADPGVGTAIFDWKAQVGEG